MVEIHQVLWSLSVHVAVRHDAQLVCDSLRYIEPVLHGVQEPRQATVKLVCRADHPSCGIQYLGRTTGACNSPCRFQKMSCCFVSKSQRLNGDWGQKPTPLRTLPLQKSRQW